ncbi:MAG TPA: response regulator transcription factor, partial [Chloroflexota bacterium]|nr:response regulator transcription factor [Chloroflexota bacterium]
SAAKRYYDQELAEARAIDDQWLIAIALHQRALLAIDEGDLGAASELLREAMGVWRLSSDRVLAIRLLEGAAHLALVQDQPLRAIRLAGAASNLGETYGDTGSETLRAIFVERLAAARRQLGSRAAAAWEEGRALSSKEAFEHAARLEPEPPPRDPLTPRERQVAALLARGLTNREIAELLIVSEGTAKVHVEHILNKLGMSSRAEVAAWAARTGLAEAAAEI